MNNDNRLKYFEILLSLSSIVIAVCAIYLTYQQGDAARKHNILSVRPLIIIEDEVDYKNKLLRFKVNNCGLGPAILGQNKIRFNGKDFEPTMKNWAAIFEASKIGWDNIILSDVRVVRPGDTTELIAMHYVNNDNVDSLIKNFKNGLEISLEYCDLYNIKYNVRLKRQ